MHHVNLQGIKRDGKALFWLLFTLFFLASSSSRFFFQSDSLFCKLDLFGEVSKELQLEEASLDYFYSPLFFCSSPTVLHHHLHLQELLSILEFHPIVEEILGICYGIYKWEELGTLHGLVSVIVTRFRGYSFLKIIHHWWMLLESLLEIQDIDILIYEYIFCACTQYLAGRLSKIQTKLPDFARICSAALV